MPQPESNRIRVARKDPEPRDGLQITWKDGLPDDPFERMQIETGLKAASLTSTYSSVKRLLDGDDAATEEEMKRIREEQAEASLAEAAMGGGEPVTGDELGQSAQELAKLRAERGKGDEGGKQSPT